MRYCTSTLCYKYGSFFLLLMKAYFRIRRRFLTEMCTPLKRCNLVTSWINWMAFQSTSVRNWG